MYRGLSIGSSVCKVLIQIILKRLQKWYNAQISEFQNGLGDWSWMHGRRIHCKTCSTNFHHPSAKKYTSFSSICQRHSMGWYANGCSRLFVSVSVAPTMHLSISKKACTRRRRSRSTTTVQAQHFRQQQGIDREDPRAPACMFNLFFDWVMRVFLLQAAQQYFFQHK